MFTTDRDLLIVEPHLFRDVLWVGQRLLKATCTISGSVLTVSSPDTTPEAADITTGHVAVVDGAAYEVLERTGEMTLTLSRLRPSVASPAIPVPDQASRPVHITTFAPQIRMIHQQMLRMLGIEPVDSNIPGAITETAITNGRELAPMQTFGALHIILAAAAATTGPQSPLGIRASFYRTLYAQDRGRAVCTLDLDGDGIGETTRRMNVASLDRV
jgi:hypothetical protein